MTTGYLMVDHPNPYTPQGTYPRRGTRGKLTGTCILHTTEGAWTAGVQSLINLVRSRSDYGCYHRACDWQDIALLYPWEWETWQDSETNNWAVGISAACRTSDWAIMPADVREGYYRNMARMAADFVQYMKAEYGITVPLKRITGAQARAGVPGFCAHGDSGLHRSDPGADFDWTTFFNYTRQALGSAAIAPAGTTQEDTLSAAEVAEIKKHQTEQANRVIEYVGALVVSGYKVGDTKFPGTSKVDIVNQQTIRTILGLVQQLAVGKDLTPEQVEAAVAKALKENTVNVDITLSGKPEVL